MYIRLTFIVGPPTYIPVHMYPLLLVPPMSRVVSPTMFASNGEDRYPVHMRVDHAARIAGPFSYLLWYSNKLKLCLHDGNSRYHGLDKRPIPFEGVIIRFNRDRPTDWSNGQAPLFHGPWMNAPCGVRQLLHHFSRSPRIIIQPRPWHNSRR